MYLMCNKWSSSVCRQMNNASRFTSPCIRIHTSRHWTIKYIFDIDTSKRFSFFEVWLKRDRWILNNAPRWRSTELSRKSIVSFLNSKKYVFFSLIKVFRKHSYVSQTVIISINNEVSQYSRCLQFSFWKYPCLFHFILSLLNN